MIEGEEYVLVQSVPSSSSPVLISLKLNSQVIQSLSSIDDSNASVTFISDKEMILTANDVQYKLISTSLDEDIHELYSLQEDNNDEESCLVYQGRSLSRYTVSTTTASKPLAKAQPVSRRTTAVIDSQVLIQSLSINKPESSTKKRRVSTASTSETTDHDQQKVKLTLQDNVNTNWLCIKSINLKPPSTSASSSSSSSSTPSDTAHTSVLISEEDIRQFYNQLEIRNIYTCPCSPLKPVLSQSDTIPTSTSSSSYTTNGHNYDLAFDYYIEFVSSVHADVAYQRNNEPIIVHTNASYLNSSNSVNAQGTHKCEVIAEYTHKNEIKWAKATGILWTGDLKSCLQRYHTINAIFSSSPGLSFISFRFTPSELGQVWGRYESSWPDVECISSVYSESNIHHLTSSSKVPKGRRQGSSHKPTTSPSSEPHSTLYKPRLYCEDLLNHTLNCDFLRIDNTPLLPLTLPIMDPDAPIDSDIDIQILESALYDLHKVLELSSHELTNEVISPYTTDLKCIYRTNSSSSGGTGARAHSVGIGCSEEYYMTAALFDQSMRLMCMVYAMYIYSKTHV